MKFKVMYDGGDLNGAIRYYESLTVAKREARKYVNRNKRKGLGGGNVYAEVRTAGYFSTLLYTYEAW